MESSAFSVFVAEIYQKKKIWELICQINEVDHHPLASWFIEEENDEDGRFVKKTPFSPLDQELEKQRFNVLETLIHTSLATRGHKLPTAIFFIINSIWLRVGQIFDENFRKKSYPISDSIPSWDILNLHFGPCDVFYTVKTLQYCANLDVFTTYLL